MVKILYQKKGVFFAVLSLDGSCPMCIKYRKRNGAQKHDNETRIGKIFYQPKRLDFIFIELILHNLLFKDSRGHALPL